MLRATGISRWQGAQVILDEVSVSLDAGDRVGVVGPNGIGKTTLLRILAGIEPADGGRIERRPPSLTVGYLPQEPDPADGETLLAYLRRRTGVTEADRELDVRTEALAQDPDALDAYTESLDHFLSLGGADIEIRAAEICAAVGLLDGRGGIAGEQRLHQAMTTLSGGEAARALLAAILLSRHDVLLLDEPTNNLDFAGLDQLEAFVHDAPGAVMVVSHDRAFLDRAVSRILEIQEHSHQAREFAGGWTDFIAGRDLARGQQYEAHGKYVSERDRLRDRQRTQTLWSEGGVRKHKRSGETDKHIRSRKVARSEKQAGKAKITERAIERLEVVDKPWEGWRLDLQLTPTARSGDVVARLDEAVIERREVHEGVPATARDRGGPSTIATPIGGSDAVPARSSEGFRLGPIDLEIGWQDRVGILGRNGAGKSTLIGGLLGTYPIVSGSRWLGPGVVVGELDQGRGRFAGDEAMLTTFQRDSAMPLSESRSLLAKFGLGAEHVDRPGSSLSPGERSRALLALLMASGVNCLVLDEPTNHLDLAAIEQLESALADFEGTLVVVSHDRRFLEALALTRTIDL